VPSKFICIQDLKEGHAVVLDENDKIAVFDCSSLLPGDILIVDYGPEGAVLVRLLQQALHDGDRYKHENAGFTHVGVYLGQGLVTDAKPGFGIRAVSLAIFLNHAKRVTTLRWPDDFGFDPAILAELADDHRRRGGYQRYMRIAQEGLNRLRGQHDVPAETQQHMVCTTYADQLLRSAAEKAWQGHKALMPSVPHTRYLPAELLDRDYISDNRLRLTEFLRYSL
jgi:hypothetical protein